MAGDWIKMRCDLADDPAVIGIACRLDIDEDAVVGKLHRLWAWANTQTVDGNAASVTEKWIDRHLHTPGFARAMADNGWLAIDEQGVQIPKFERHNGQSAKQRALTAIRAEKNRSKSNAKSNAAGVTFSAPREEKRREELNTPLPPKGGMGLEGFEEFWKRYPRKTAKAAASKAWSRLSPDAQLRSLILEAVERQKTCEPWVRGVYPHAATWLNGRRWEDEASSPASAQPSESDEQRRLRVARDRERDKQEREEARKSPSIAEVVAAIHSNPRSTDS